MAKFRRQVLNDGHTKFIWPEGGTPQIDPKTMAYLESSYATGAHPSAPLRVVWLSHACGSPVPDWALSALSFAYHKALSGDLTSWDDEFGRPNTKGQGERDSRDFDNANKIWILVAEAKARGEAIDNGLMEKIAEEGFGEKSKVWELYKLACSGRGKP